MAKKDQPAASMTGSGAQDEQTQAGTSESGGATSIPGHEATSNQGTTDLTGSMSSDASAVIRLPDDRVMTDYAQSRYFSAIEVSAARDGFRRAGIVWNRAPRTVRLDELSHEQMQLLAEEPMLLIRCVELASDAGAE